MASELRHRSTGDRAAQDSHGSAASHGAPAGGGHEAEVNGGGWRHRLGQRLESHSFHRVVMALIVVDTALVFLEHLIEANVFPSEYHAVTHAVHHGCHILGVTILAIFCVEIVAQVVAKGFLFFTHVGCMLDAVIVVASLYADLRLGKQFVVTLRMWRLVRIAHGVFEAMETRLHEHQHEFAHKLRESEQREKALRDEVAALKTRLADVGGA